MFTLRQNCLVFLLLFHCALSSIVASEKSLPLPEITITFDDFPMGSSKIFEKKERVKVFKEKLTQLNIPVAFFCIGEGIESKDGQECLSLICQNHFLGNHSYHHPHLSELSLTDFKNEIQRTEKLLSSYPSYKKWFRFPYLDFGDRNFIGGSSRKRAGAFCLLKQEGYQHGYITINTFDWYIDGQLKKAIQEKRTVNWDNLRSAYLSLLDKWINDAQQRWSQILRKKIVHVLLLHQNDLNAIFLKDIVDLLTRKQWNIVSPEKAYNNPIPYLSKFANSKGSIFKKKHSISTEQVDKVLFSHKVFGEINSNPHEFHAISN